MQTSTDGIERAEAKKAAVSYENCGFSDFLKMRKSNSWWDRWTVIVA